VDFADVGRFEVVASVVVVVVEGWMIGGGPDRFGAGSINDFIIVGVVCVCKSPLRHLS